MPHLELTFPRPDVAVLTLNRPEKLNALNYEMVEQLHGSLDAIGANNDCRVVVITGGAGILLGS
jgi:enoyl-CoA hydratase/carnithine racemase